MKQQAIKERLQKSLPSAPVHANENVASTFNVPGGNLLQPIEITDKTETIDLLWPVEGSLVRVRLDSETEIRGVVACDETTSAQLRSVGLIGVETDDGHFIEVPFPDENVTVTHNLNYRCRATSETYSGVSNGTSDAGKNSLVDFQRPSIELLGCDDAIPMSSWPSDHANSALNAKTRVLIGKRLSQSIGSQLDIDDDVDGDYGGLKRAVNSLEDDDDVQWVDGHESLSTKKNKRKNRGADDGENTDTDDSDEEEVRWQTPSDSAEIDIEVLMDYSILSGRIITLISTLIFDKWIFNNVSGPCISATSSTEEHD